MTDRDIRIRRLTMRSWRRGTREMDLILGPFADRHLATLNESEMDVFELLLAENDQDLYPWITARLNRGEGAGPARLHDMLDRVARDAAERIPEIRGA